MGCLINFHLLRQVNTILPFLCVFFFFLLLHFHSTSLLCRKGIIGASITVVQHITCMTSFYRLDSGFQDFKIAGGEKMTR